MICRLVREARLVPGRTELAAAADVGERVDAALLQPQLAGDGAVGRRLARFEPTIGIEQGRVAAVELDVLPVDKEVGDPGAVGRDRFALLRDQARRVELRGLAHDLLEVTAAGIREPQRRRREEVGNGEECLVVLMARICDRDRRIVRKLQRRARPTAVGGRLKDQRSATDIVEDRNE